jgi:hypothetical protein
MTDRDTRLRRFVPELTRLWMRDPLAALRRGARIQAAFIEVVAESVGQQRRLTQDLTRRTYDTWTRLYTAGREGRP